MDATDDEDFGTGDHVPGLAQKVLIVLLGSLLLMVLFLSSALVTLTYDLPPGGMSETIISAAETWHGWMTSTGFAGVTERVGEWVVAAHDAPIE